MTYISERLQGKIINMARSVRSAPQPDGLYTPRELFDVPINSREVSPIDSEFFYDSEDLYDDSDDESTGISLRILNAVRSYAPSAPNPEKVACDLIDSLQRKRAEGITVSGPDGKETKFTNGLGYLVSPISSTNPLHLARNYVDIHKRKKIIQNRHHIPVFTSAELWVPTINHGLVNAHPRTTKADQWKIQRAIFSSGVITAAYFPANWREDSESIDAHESAKRTGIPVFILKPVEKPLPYKEAV